MLPLSNLPVLCVFGCPDSCCCVMTASPNEEATASESLESRAQAAVKAEAVEPSSFSKLTSFLFGEREEAPTEEEATALPVVAEPEGEATEQPPPPPPAKHWFSRESESIARNAEERHQRMAGWYNGAPEAAALRAAWGEYPGTSDALQAWPGFVQVLWRPPMPAFSHQSANQLATAQRRAVMAFSRATRGQRAVAFILYFYGCLLVQVGAKFTVKKAFGELKCAYVPRPVLARLWRTDAR